MAFPDDPDDDVGFVPPLPPEDRLWRHPSERVPSRPAAVAASRRHGGRRTASIIGVALGLVAVVVGGSAVLPDDPTRRTAASASPTDGEDPPPGLLDSLAPALVHVTAERPDGSVTATGVLVRDDGHLVTTADPLLGATSITVHTADGSSFNATVVGTDRADDLAVLDIPVKDAPVARFAEVERPNVGDRVFVVGRMIDSARPWVGSGAIDALRERVVANDGSVLLDMVRTAVSTPTTPTAALVCRSDGTVLGIVSSRSRRLVATGRSPSTLAATNRAVVWAVPSTWVMRVTNDIIDTGTLHRGWIGVAAHEQGDAGVVVRSVTADGPAARAGIAVGDRIVSVDDAPVVSADDLVIAVRARHPGESMQVTTIRDGEVRRVDVRVSEQR